MQYTGTDTSSSKHVRRCLFSTLVFFCTLCTAVSDLSPLLLGFILVETIPAIARVAAQHGTHISMEQFMFITK